MPWRSNQQNLQDKFYSLLLNFHLTEISALKADIVNLMDNIPFIVNTMISFITAISYSDPQGSNSIKKR